MNNLKMVRGDGIPREDLDLNMGEVNLQVLMMMMIVVDRVVVLHCQGFVAQICVIMMLIERETA